MTDETKIYMKKFTFKTEQPTGRYRSFYAPYHIIKFNKKEAQPTPICGEFHK